VHAWNGNTELAGRYFERARQLGVGGGSFELAYAVFQMRNHEFADAARAAARGVADGGASTDWVEPMIAAMQGEAEASNALAALDAAGERGPLDPQVETTARVILGDVDGALTVAWSLLKPGQTYETEFLFLDELAELRARPEFLQLLTSLGITEYWQQADCYWQEQAVRCD